MNFFKKIFSRKEIGNTILTVLVFSLSFIPLLWLRDNQILLGYDTVYPLNAVDFLRDRLYSWTSVQGFGLDQSGQQGSLVVHFIDSIPQLLGASAQLSQKIVFSFWFFMLIFSAYIFVVKLEQYEFIKSKYLRYIFPVLYSVNFYVLQAWWIAERTKFSLMVATPLILIILLSLVKGKVSKTMIVIKAIIAAFILTIFNGGGWGGLSLYGGFLEVLFCFYVFHLFILIYKKRFRDAIMLFTFLPSFIFSYVLLNAYTLVPFILSTLKNYGTFVSSAGGIEGLVSWTIYLSADASFINLLRLQGIPDWYNSGIHHPYSAVYLKNNIFVFLSFLFPVFLFSSFIIGKKTFQKILPFVVFLFLVSLFLTAGLHAPFGFAYEFLMKNIPGFIIFRSAIFKFGYAFWFASGLLIAIFLSSAVEHLVVKFRRFAVLSLLLPLIVVISLVAYHFPYLTGDIFRIDKSDVSSRVELPSYIFDFSSWWKQNGKDSKILLLPKLNDNWLFEQYKWNYLSLFPVLGNFANNGLVENSDQLSGEELNLVNALYDSILGYDYPRMDFYIKSLGINYFLVRRDFYYNLQGQETDNPIAIEEKIRINPRISFVKSFGEWILYKYKIDNSLFFAANKALIFDGGGSSLSDLSGDLLSFNDDVYSKNLPIFNKDLVFIECLSCKAEREEISIQIPKPKILIDSNLYDLAQLRNKLRKPKSEPYDQHLFGLIGDMLKYAGQLNELVYQDKGETYVNRVREKYISLIEDLSESTSNIQHQSPNPYSTAIISESYLDYQANYLTDLLIQQSSRRSNQIEIQKVIYKLSNLSDKLKEFYGEKDFNTNKYYSFQVRRPKEYQVKILQSTLGVLADGDFSKISLKLDNKEATTGARTEGKFIVFNKVFLNTGSHTLKVSLPDQKNIISYTRQEKLSNNSCIASYVDNFSQNLTYRLSFSSKNNFDPNFFYFIDGGDIFSPAQIGYLPIAGEQVKENKVVISQSSVHLSNTSNTLRIAFCAPSLTQSLYENSIENLKIVLLTKPEIVLEADLPEKKLFLPEVSFKKLDQARYEVNIKNATDPFLLVFSQRYSDGWRSTIGKHVKANGFENAWLIDKKGNYAVNVEYTPQKYFYLGTVISLSSLIISLFIVWRFRKNK